jgi:hypothetical protein
MTGRPKNQLMLAVGLSDCQMRALTNVSSTSPVEKRSCYVERVFAFLKLRGDRRPDDRVFDLALKAALTGLQQSLMDEAS